MSAIPRHMTQSIALEESPVPGAMRMGVNIVAILLLTFLVWSAFAKVQEVASAQGEIVPSGHVQTIQHLEGGLIKEILVEDGQLVEKGQPLVKLDDTNANADLGQMRARQNSLKLQAERLRSFANNNALPRDLTADEQAILTSMEEARTSQEAVLRDQISQKERELQGIISSRASLQRNLQLAQEEYAINNKLSERGSVSRVAVMSSERQVNALKGELETSISLENQTTAALNEAHKTGCDEKSWAGRSGAWRNQQKHRQAGKRFVAHDLGRACPRNCQRPDRPYDRFSCRARQNADGNRPG